MKRFIIVVTLAAIAVFSLTSCGTNYSPMDSYCKGVVNNIADSTRHAQEVSEFLKK